jgi:hypothetical protein
MKAARAPRNRKISPMANTTELFPLRLLLTKRINRTATIQAELRCRT